MIGAVLVGALVASPASAAGVDHYVATTGVDAGNCQNIASPCLTINYAVSQAGADDIINVAAGTYAENVVVDKSLVFKGANAGIPAGTSPGARGAESVEKTFRSGTGTSVSDLFGTTDMNVTIDGFQVDTQGDAALEGATELAGLIHLHGGSGSGTSVVNNIVAGAAVFQPSCTAASCTAPNQMAPMGVSVGSGALDMSDNTIRNFRYGARAQQQLGGSFSSLVAAIDGNVITGVSVQGVGIGGVTGVQQAGGTISNNEIDAVGRASSPAGIVITNAGNTITGNSLLDLGRGATIVLCKKFDTTNNTIDDNDFDNAPMVIAVSTDGGQCATGSGGDTEGVGSWVNDGGQFDGFNANGNNFVNGPVGFVSSASSGFSANKPITAGPIDITCNYWGDPSGPTIASNPGGTGTVLSYSTINGQPEFDYVQWEVADGGPCNGGDRPPTVTIGTADGLERDLVTGSVFVPVFLSEPNPVPTVITYYTVDGTAIAGVDYIKWGSPTNPRSVTIPAGALQSQINVPVLTDNLVEADENFSVVINSVSGGDAVGSGSGTGNIIDSDVLAGPNPVINVSNGTVYEGDDGQRVAKFYIQLSRAPASNVSFNYTTSDGTATSPTDYIAKLPGTVNFAPGQISKTVDVLVNSDTAIGSDRDFNLNVTITGGSPVEELNMVGVSTILDDD